MIKFKQFAQSTMALAALTASVAFAENHTGFSPKALSDLDFSPVGELPIEIAVLWGNPAKGPSAVMLKFPPNFPGGMHTHTHGYHGLVVRGASKHWTEEGSEEDAVLQLPGDYWYQVGGQVHQDSFPTDEETILFLQFEGPLDTHFVD